MNTPKAKVHGLRGRRGNNQTRKGPNYRYVIQAKAFAQRKTP